MSSSGQTHFTHGKPHFSQTHGGHAQGITNALQQDLQLRNSDGRVVRHWGTAVPRGTVIQTTLDQFKR
jgi:hypothetical protein